MPGRSFLADCRNAGLRGAGLCGTAASDNDELIVAVKMIDPFRWRPLTRKVGRSALRHCSAGQIIPDY